MSRTKRTPNGRLARRIVPLIVGAAVAATSALLLSGSPASATDQVTVSFTSDGPSPASVTIQPGDQVTFRNDVDPDGQTLLGVVTGAVKSVTIDVANASNPGFSLTPGQSRTLTYSSPVHTTYTATYRTTTLLLLPGRAMDTTGTLLVGEPEAAPAAPANPTTATGGQNGPAPA
ncbi:MAG TPA: hypothetical protein VIR27_04560, partial [Mycobacteriales bacterium]